MPNFVKRLDDFTGRLATILAVIGGIGIVGLIGTIVVSVIWRYGLNNPIFGVNDVATLILIIVAGAAVAFGARNGAHVSVDVIGQHMGPRLTWLANAVMRLATLAIVVLACYALFAKACGFEKACVTTNLSIEHRYFYYYLGLCLGVYALQILVDFLKGITGGPVGAELDGVH